MKQIIQLGIRRSGNHGITNLLVQSFNDQKYTVHLNDLQDKGMKWYRYFKQQPITKNYMDREWTGFKGCSLCVFSFENQRLTRHFIRDLQKLKKKQNDLHLLIILRHPFNNLASAYRIYTQNGQIQNKETLDKCLEIKSLWKEYASFILKKHKDFQPIFYYKFYNDKSYRENICKKLGIRCDDSKLTKIYSWGWSSFSGYNKLDYNALFSRYKNYEDDEWFKQNVLQDTELKNLWNRINNTFSINFKI